MRMSTTTCIPPHEYRRRDARACSRVTRAFMLCRGEAEP